MKHVGISTRFLLRGVCLWVAFLPSAGPAQRM